MQTINAEIFAERTPNRLPRHYRKRYNKKTEKKGVSQVMKKQRKKPPKGAMIAVGIGLPLLFIGLPVALLSENETLNTIAGAIIAILIVAAIVGGIVYYMLKIRPKQIHRKYHCPACDAQYDYDRDVAWKVVSTVEERGVGGTFLRAKIEGVKTCPQCRQTVSFGMSIATAKNSDNGRIQRCEPEHVMRKLWNLKDSPWFVKSEIVSIGKTLNG